jgi:[ribosomal protein S5]-alanine N-acetyltransferase
MTGPCHSAHRSSFARLWWDGLILLGVCRSGSVGGDPPRGDVPDGLAGLADQIDIAIAHRLHTGHDADSIVVVDHGRIIEIGWHLRLLGPPRPGRRLCPTLVEPAPNRRENGTSGTMARMVLPTPLLHTDRLRLRPFDDADADALYAMQSSPHVLRYWDAPPWTERGRAQKFIAKCRKMAEDGIGARLAVDRLEDGAFIGWCSLTRWNPDYRSAALGYCFTDAAWGHGYATEAARALLQWAYDTLDLNRIQAETDTRNAASARVLEKVGFVREGTLRQDCIVNGDVSDSWVYGLIGSD